MRLLLALALFVGLAGCQTAGRSTEPPAVPAVLQPSFMPCVPSDGALSVQAFQEDKLAGSVEVEWLAKPNGEFDIEVVNAVGLTVLRLGRHPGGLTVEGDLAKKMPKLGISKGGFLLVNDERVGLRVSEIPCMLAFRVPRAWMMQLSDVEIADKTIVMDVSDTIRDIVVTAKGVDGPRTGTLCARFSWRRYLFMHPTFNWCQTFGNGSGSGSGITKPEATLKGLGDYSLRWVAIDEQ